MSLVNMSDYMTALLEKQEVIKEKLDLLLAENEDYYSDVALGLISGVANFKKAGEVPPLEQLKGL